MTLATHAVIGAAAAQIFSTHPAAAFLAGFLSHFIADAIPHGHYKLLSMHKDPQNVLNTDMILGRAFFTDLWHIGLDASLGVMLAFLFFQTPGAPINQAMVIGIFAGLLPDALQFAYMKTRREPLVILQRFHHWIHARKKFDGRPFITAAIETVFIILAAILGRWPM